MTVPVKQIMRFRLMQHPNGGTMIATGNQCAEEYWKLLAWKEVEIDFGEVDLGSDPNRSYPEGKFI